MPCEHPGKELEQSGDDSLLLHVKANWIWDPLSIKRLYAGSSCAFCWGSTVSHNETVIQLSKLAWALSAAITSSECCNQTSIVWRAACSHRPWWSYISTVGWDMARQCQGQHASLQYALMDNSATCKASCSSAARSLLPARGLLVTPAAWPFTNAWAAMQPCQVPMCGSSWAASQVSLPHITASQRRGAMSFPANCLTLVRPMPPQSALWCLDSAI